MTMPIEPFPDNFEINGRTVLSIAKRGRLAYDCSYNVYHPECGCVAVVRHKTLLDKRKSNMCCLCSRREAGRRHVNRLISTQGSAEPKVHPDKWFHDWAQKIWFESFA